MVFVVLPFNAAEGVPPAYGRMFSAYPAAPLQAMTEGTLGTISFRSQVESEDGQRLAMTNFTEMCDLPMLKSVFEGTEADRLMDGLLEPHEGGWKLTYRLHAKGIGDPMHEESFTFGPEGLFEVLHKIKLVMAEQAQIDLDDEMKAATVFGTENPQAFLDYLEGFDGRTYLEAAQGRVTADFNPQHGIDRLVTAIQADPAFDQAIAELSTTARMCAAYQIGSYDEVQKALERATEARTDSATLWFAMGEVNEQVGNFARASDAFEKAIRVHEKEWGENPEGEPRAARAGVLTKLAQSQMELNMPVNAERNLRRAVELVGPESPMTELLAVTLERQGRGHEAVGLFREHVVKYPQDSRSHIRLAGSLASEGRLDDAVKVVDAALEVLEEDQKLLVKRAAAPMLAQSGDTDRAMDFYEDWLEAQPKDIPALLEYADTLQKADREFEVPPVLRNVMASEPDQNTRARTLQWLTELEQANRVQVVREAQQKLESGDADAALKDLKPMRNWLADFWPMWMVMAAAHNQKGEYQEAEETAVQLLNLYPGCEPGYNELANALNGQGRAEEGYNVLSNACRLMPTSLPLRLALGFAAKRMGRRDEALAIARGLREAVGPDDGLEQVLSELERG